MPILEKIWTFLLRFRPLISEDTRSMKSKNVFEWWFESWQCGFAEALVMAATMTRRIIAFWDAMVSFCWKQLRPHDSYSNFLATAPLAPQAVKNVGCIKKIYKLSLIHDFKKMFNAKSLKVKDDSLQIKDYSALGNENLVIFTTFFVVTKWNRIFNYFRPKFTIVCKMSTSTSRNSKIFQRNSTGSKVYPLVLTE